MAFGLAQVACDVAGLRLGILVSAFPETYAYHLSDRRSEDAPCRSIDLSRSSVGVIGDTNAPARAS